MDSLGRLFTSELSSVASDRGSGAGENLPGCLQLQSGAMWDLGGNTPDALPLRHVTAHGLLGYQDDGPHARQKSVNVFFAARRENLSSGDVSDDSHVF